MAAGEDGNYDGMDRFDMDGDYEGGRWIGGEFYYERRRDRPVQSREDALYGVFGDGGGSSDSEDSDSRRGGRRRKRRRDAGTVDLSKPVNFVSTGSVLPTEEGQNDVDMNDSSSNPSSTSRGLGFGLGFAGAGGEAMEEEESDQSELQTEFGRQVREAAERRRKEKEREKDRQPKTTSRTAVPGVSGEMGKFESHTKGFGMNYLKKHGFVEGMGLGKNAQGIVAPIEAKLRPKNMGMGFNDYKEAKVSPVEDAPVIAKLEKPMSQQGGEKLWLKKKQGRKKGKVLSAEELLARKQEQMVDTELVQKVIDMRGPQVRVLSSLENLNAEAETVKKDVLLPELQYNLRLLVEQTEIEILRTESNLRRAREKAATLLYENEKIQRDKAQQRERLQVMEKIAGVLESVKGESAAGSLTLESLLHTFGELKVSFEVEYKLSNLAFVACEIAYPLFLRVFQKWDPLQDPSNGLKLMLSWKNLLEGDQPHDYSDGSYSMSFYAQLVSEVILPAIRIAGINTWQARDPEPMLRFLELWDGLLPPPVLQMILEQIVMPKLTAAVDSWDPRLETVAIHVWVHPWLPLLGQRLESLYHTIRFKLGSVLYAWHASDASAYEILSPWKDIFDSASWDDLIVRYILPKLKLALQQFQINPADQQLDQFLWVIKWAPAIPTYHLVNLLEVDFFVKWHHALYHWISSPNADYGAIHRWYQGWRDLFPHELHANDRIRMLFRAGLEMMSQAADGLEIVQPGVRENIDYLRATEKRGYMEQQKVQYQQNVPEMSFKETIQAYAAEQGVLFMPRSNKFYNGFSVYQFGSVNISIDPVKRLLFAQSQDGTDRWNPVTLSDLMDLQVPMNRPMR